MNATSQKHCRYCGRWLGTPAKWCPTRPYCVGRRAEDLLRPIHDPAARDALLAAVTPLSDARDLCFREGQQDYGMAINEMILMIFKTVTWVNGPD